MTSVGPFLPSHLRAALSRSAGPREPPFEERFDAGLTFSDISGFTALTEELQALGRDGAEEMGRLVSTALGPAIEAVEAEGGDVACFSGDAILGVFPGPGGVERARAALRRIDDSMARLGPLPTSQGPVRLAIRQALHRGTVRGLHLGAGDHRRYVLTGSALRSLVLRQSAAPRGTPALSRRSLRPSSAGTGIAPAGSADEDLLRRYLDPTALDVLRSFEGSFRHVAVLFLESRAQDLPSLQALFQELAARLVDLGGLLLETDVSPHGTRWLCIFGIPSGHEDDASRAARLLVSLLETLPRSSLRGGLNAGTVANVLVGTASRQNLSVVGDVVNTAARALHAASWGEGYATEDAQRLFRRITTRELGGRAAKGKREPLLLHAVTGISNELTEVHPLTPLIGRDSEMAWLLESLDAAAAGEGSAVALRGEAGLGKSRLAWEVAAVARERGYDVGIGKATAIGNRPWGALADLLRHVLGDGAEPGAALAREGERLGLPEIDVRHLADLLGVGSDLPPLPPAVRRLNAGVALRGFLLARSRRSPLCWVMEDLQACDELSAETLSFLVPALRGSRALLLLTYRAGYTPPASVTERVLAELPAIAVNEMLRALLGHVPDAVARAVHARAEGNPLYVEQLVGTLMDSGLLRLTDGGYVLSREPGPSDLPASIEALVQARVDHLDPAARRVLQVAAVVGRPFPRALLSRLGVDQEPLQTLAERALLVERPDRDLLGFRHTMTRDVVYAGLLGARRRDLHRLVAEALEHMGPASGAEHASFAAEHWDRAGEPARARPRYLQALSACGRTGATLEARRLFQAYRALLPAPTEESIDARCQLAAVLFRGGLSHEALAEASLAVNEARAAGMPDREAAGRVEEARVLHALGRPEVDGVLAEALRLARQSASRRLEAMVRQLSGSTALSRSDFSEAASSYQAALDLAEALGDEAMRAYQLQGLAIVAAQQGRLHEAEDLCHQALAACRRAGDRPAEAYAIANLATNLSVQGRPAEAFAAFAQALEIARDLGERRFQAFLLGNLGTLKRSMGDIEDAERLYLDALAVQRECGGGPGEAHVLGNLANLLDDSGRGGDAAAHRGEALRIARAAGERLHEAVLYVDGAHAARQRGDLPSADRELRSAEEILAAVGDPMEVAKARAERGLLRLALGEDARDDLGAVREARAALRLPSGSELGRLEEELQKALDKATL